MNEALIESLNGVATMMALALAAVFMVAAVVKAIAPETTAREFRQLGLPASAVLARVVPAFELLVVAALLVMPRLGSALATATLIAFTGVLVVVLRSGRQVSCGCLGSLSSEPISWSTVARNGILLLMAVAAGVSPRLVVPDIESVVAASISVLILVVAVQLFTLHRSIGRIWSVQLAGEAAGSQGSGGKQR